MKIIYFDNGIGWHPIFHMVTLMSKYFEADLQIIKSEDYTHQSSYFKKISWSFKRSRKGEDCLIIVPSASDIEILFTHNENWRKNFGRVAVYVIDSFWTDRIPWFSKYLSHIDRYFVTNPEDAEKWSLTTKTESICVPWGADVFKLGWQNEKKDIDLLRLGRQPIEWDDDVISQELCLHNSIKFHGRPPSIDDPVGNHILTLSYMKRAKFILCFSNKVDSSPYTHPTKEYITGRWTDALASGAIVIGIAPDCKIVKDQLWPTAILNIQATSHTAVVDAVNEAKLTWSEEVATLNNINALRKLDWRWRFKEISGFFKLNEKNLDKDLIKMDRIVTKYLGFID